MHDTIARALRKYDELAARLSADETLTSEARAERMAAAQETLRAELRGPVNEAERIADAAARDALTLRAAADHVLTERGIAS